MIREAEHRLAAVGCVKVNLQVVSSNRDASALYKSSGYMVEERVSMSKLLRTV